MSSCEPKKFVKKVGMIIMPSGPLKKKIGSAYITKNNIDWFNLRGVEVIPIPYDTTDYDYYFNAINGLYLQGGPGYEPAYIKTVKEFLDRAVKANIKGDFFPVWGTCHGFQMLIMMVGKIYPLESFDSNISYISHLTFTKDAVKSRLFKTFTPEFLDYISSPKHVFFSHKFGISVKAFRENPELTRIFNAVTTSRDRQGNEYVSTIEGKVLPFYGTQYHPERQPVMEPFRDFFLDEIMKNKHNGHIDAKHRMLKGGVKCLESKMFDDLYKIQRCATRRNPKLHSVFQMSGCYFFD